MSTVSLNARARLKDLIRRCLMSLKIPKEKQQVLKKQRQKIPVIIQIVKTKTVNPSIQGDR